MFERKCTKWQWLFTRRSCTQNHFVYIHDGRVHNMILSIYTMVVYIMSVVYIHDSFVLMNIGQQVRKFFVLLLRFFCIKLIQLLDSTVPKRVFFFKYIINFIHIKEIKFNSFSIVKHLRVAKAVNAQKVLLHLDPGSSSLI